MQIKSYKQIKKKLNPVSADLGEAKFADFTDLDRKFKNAYSAYKQHKGVIILPYIILTESSRSVSPCRNSLVGLNKQYLLISQTWIGSLKCIQRV